MGLGFLNLQGARDFLEKNRQYSDNRSTFALLLQQSREHVHLLNVIGVTFDPFYGAVAGAVANGSPA